MEEYYDCRCKPQVAWLNVNQACNMRCKWCYCEANDYDPHKDMPLETAIELVNIATDAGVTHFNIIGGEPTLWSHLFTTFDHIRSNGATVGLITNAARFGDDDFWDKYKANPADRISISVKSTVPSEFKIITGSSIKR